MRKVGFMLIITFLRSFSLGPLSQTQGSMSSVAESPQVIEVSAKKYEFSPHEVHVKKGTRVQLKLRTDDSAHGLKLNLYPEGTSKEGNPGLLFEHPQDNAKVKKGQERIIEFVAVRAGTYDFKCSVQCGSGHGRMIGKLIVEE
jgi:heme/copper-type cytochrome/quinol oxidase subunit 2